MPAIPKNKMTVRRHVRLMVYIAEKATQLVTTENAQPYVHCTEVFWGVGDALPYAILEIDLGRLGMRVMNEFVIANMDRQVEIWTVKEKMEEGDDDIRDKPLFWGEITESSIELDRGERKGLKVSIEKFHFGEIAKGQKVYVEGESEAQTVDLDLEFNPLVDGKVRPNRVAKDDPRNPEDFDIWVDPDSVVSQTAIEKYHGNPTSWDLNSIANTLCKWLNWQEEFIENPQVTQVLRRGTLQPAIKHEVIKRGSFLNEYLSYLLPQYGFQWYLKFTKEEDYIRPKITYYKRGEGGVERELLMQAPGERFSDSETTCTGLQLKYSIAEICSKVTVQGAFKEFEITKELFRAWEPESDSQIETNDKTTNHIGRKWVANEGGDYTELRDEIEPPPSAEDLFGEGAVAAIKRRNLYNCLELRTDDKGAGHRCPAFVEMSTDDGETWRPIPKLEGDDDDRSDFHGFTLLPDEIGIWISTTKIPAALQETDPAKLRLRITGTIRADQRIAYTAEDEDESATSHVVEKLLDCSDRFVYRKRRTEGPCKSALSGSADEKDDSEDIETYAKRMLAQERAAQVQATCKIPGITFEYAISDVIMRLKGRAISFDRLPSSSSLGSYLQIVGIRFLSQQGEQFTELLMEPYDA